LLRNCLLKQFLKRGWERGEDDEEDVSSYWMTVMKKSVLGTESGSTRCHSVENPLWACRKTG
jgi:hypothetical protein